MDRLTGKAGKCLTALGSMLGFHIAELEYTGHHIFFALFAQWSETLTLLSALSLL